MISYSLFLLGGDLLLDLVLLLLGKLALLLGLVLRGDSAVLLDHGQNGLVDHLRTSTNKEVRLASQEGEQVVQQRLNALQRCNK